MVPSPRVSLSLLTGLVLAVSSAFLTADEATFQNGLNDYTGAESTTLHGTGNAKLNANFGHASILGVAGVKHGGFRQLGLLRFNDISGAQNGQIPVGAKIISAKLELYKLDEPPDSGQYAATPKGHNEIRAFRMLTDWKAGSADGKPEAGSSCFAYRFFDNEQPVFWGTANVLEEGPVRNVDFEFVPRAASALHPGSGPMWMVWDITDFVQDWVTHPEANRGVYLNALGYYIGAFFASCHHADATLRPRLVVEYQ